MRRVRYSVAVSLDSYIAGPNGEYDWIIMDPAIDFGAMFAQFDTLLMGRRTYELTRSQGGGAGMPGMRVIVFSRTLRPADCSGVTLVREDAATAVAELKRQDGKDIWLFGGGELFRSLLAEGQVDTVELAVIPVLLGAGIPMLPGPCPRTSLRLATSKALGTGILLLTYDVVQVAR
jgi:dihydrofolate reductase